MTTSTNTFRYALHEQKYVILISRIHIWAWSWDGHASHVPVTLQSWTSHVTVTLWTIVMIQSRLVVEPLTWWSWAGHTAVMSWSRGGHESVTWRSWSGHAAVMVWSRGGYESVTWRSWSGHAAVTSPSRCVHVSVGLVRVDDSARSRQAGSPG